MVMIVITEYCRDKTMATEHTQNDKKKQLRIEWTTSTYISLRSRKTCINNK